MKAISKAAFLLVICQCQSEPLVELKSTLPIIEFPQVPQTIIPEEPAEVLLYEFFTKFKTDHKHEGRANNIQILTNKLHDTTLQPGEEFSFNQVVGPRTLENGFKSAPIYYLGEVLPGVGGGTCQVSSTMYAAILHASLEVIDRRPHSRMSNYIPAGLDAAVSYPKECWDIKRPDKRICYDLKFKNSYDFPIIFKFKINSEPGNPEEGILTFSIFGTGEIPKVTTRWKVYSSDPFKTRYRRIHYWKNSRKKLKQSGRLGVRGARVITTEFKNGSKSTKKVISKYNPVVEVYEIGMEFEEPDTEEIN